MMTWVGPKLPIWVFALIGILIVIGVVAAVKSAILLRQERDADVGLKCGLPAWRGWLLGGAGVLLMTPVPLRLFSDFSPPNWSICLLAAVVVVLGVLHYRDINVMLRDTKAAQEAGKARCSCGYWVGAEQSVCSECGEATKLQPTG